MERKQVAPVSPITILGGGGPYGAYVLRIAVERPLLLAFGRFTGGRPIEVPAGECLYVGSARGPGGLPPRLLRHATRTGARPPHDIRDAMVAAFARRGWRSRPPSAKRLRWNVDHLLDRAEAEIATAVLLCSPSSGLERRVAALLAADPAVSFLARGLGAHDDPGATHVLRVDADDAWWRALPARLADLV